MGASPWPVELIEIQERCRKLEVSSLSRGNDGVRVRCEGYSALLRAGQISPGQRAAATAAALCPGPAGLITSALLRAAQSLLIPFVSPLTGLTISTHADPGRRFALPWVDLLWPFRQENDPAPRSRVHWRAKTHASGTRTAKHLRSALWMEHNE